MRTGQLLLPAYFAMPTRGRLLWLLNQAGFYCWWSMVISLSPMGICSMSTQQTTHSLFSTLTRNMLTEFCRVWDVPHDVHCRVRPWGKFARMFTTHLNAPDLQTNRTALTQVLTPADNQVNTVRYTVDYLCTIVWPITHRGFCSFFEVKVTLQSQMKFQTSFMVCACMFQTSFYFFHA